MGGGLSLRRSDRRAWRVTPPRLRIVFAAKANFFFPILKTSDEFDDGWPCWTSMRMAMQGTSMQMAPLDIHSDGLARDIHADNPLQVETSQMT